MTKLQVYTNIQSAVLELLESQPKLSKKFSEELLQIIETNLRPTGKSSINPPKEIDGVLNYFCRFHQRYELAENMVISNGKSKGYCKAGISKWNKTNSTIKKLESQAVTKMTERDFDKAQKLAEEAQVLKELLNDPKAFNFDEDWSIFNG